MKEHIVIRHRPSRLVLTGIWLGGITSVGGILRMVFIAIEKVGAGRGLDTYRTHWLVQFNWIGFLVFLVAAVVALAVGLFLRLKERREIQQLQAKYSEESHG